jgi:hypothetical protein
MRFGNNWMGFGHCIPSSDGIEISFVNFGTLAIWPSGPKLGIFASLSRLFAAPPDTTLVSGRFPDFPIPDTPDQSIKPSIFDNH